MSRRRHAAHEEEHENHERWLLTYADLITLLLALFMMLYAMSVQGSSGLFAFGPRFVCFAGGGLKLLRSVEATIHFQNSLGKRSGTIRVCGHQAKFFSTTSYLCSV